VYKSEKRGRAQPAMYKVYRLKLDGVVSCWELRVQRNDLVEASVYTSF
jgi:hypothetical protein